MIRSNSFEKKYPLLAPFIDDISLRNNMLNNKDLLEKYEKNQSLIKAYLNEINKRFDKDTIKELIIEVIFKLPEELLISFVTAYLNSDEVTKSNADTLKFYKKSLSYGNEVVKYIEKNGIVSNRDYKQLPKVIVDEKFNHLITKNTYMYGNTNIVTINNLTIQEKSLLISFIESNNFDYLNLLFSNYVDLKKLLAYMNATGVNTNIINFDNINTFGEKNIFMITFIIFSIYGDSNLKNNLDTIKELLKYKRVDLVDALVDNQLVIYSYCIDRNTINDITVDEMINNIQKQRYILERAS